MKTSLLRRLRGGVSNPINVALATRAGMSWQPWNLNTLFTDTAATVPATQPGDLIAVQIDPSRGTAPGPELVTNGTFDVDLTGWSATLDASIAWSSGAMVVTRTGPTTFPIGQQTIPATIVGRAYKITATFTNPNSLDVYCGFSGLTTSQRSSATSGTLSYTAIATSTSHTIQAGMWASAGSNGQTVTFDNISVKLLPYNYFTQSTLANRPVLVRHPKRGRVNLNVYSEALNNGAWSDGFIANGTRTNGSFSVSTSEGYAYIAQNIPAITVGNNTVSFDAVCDTTVSNVPVRMSFGAASASSLVNFVAGVSQRISLTFSAAVATGIVYIGIDARDAVVSGGSNATGYIVTIDRVQTELGSTATAYQKVTSTYDVTESGQSSCWGLQHDGTNDSMATAATLDLSASDKVAVFAGWTRLNNSTSIILESSINFNNLVGAFSIVSEAAKYTWGGQTNVLGTGYSVMDSTAVTAPNSVVFSGVLNFGGTTRETENTRLALNGVDGRTTGAGGYSNFSANVRNDTIYKGARAGTSLFAQYIDFGGCVVSGLDATTDAAIISAIERQIANNTPGVVI